MDASDFKGIVDEIVTSNGMRKRRSCYYRESNEINVVLGLQKSSYSPSYYFNLGYIIKDLNDKKYPNYTDGNVRLRFDFELNGKHTDIIDIKEVLIDQFASELRRNIICYVSHIANIEALKNLIKERPNLLFQTTLITKQYLQIE
ncbi:DUF4304 domain-containing protein [Paenisporosarcina sp.]|uniref:DUF4304 domain-containing protein n=1 Tax=Paenisporosarcina sp. TaxID=1932001 RepID=UPI003C76CDB7